jgi:homoserine O-acetyltransferase
MKYIDLNKKFILESGESIENLKIAYSTFGKLNKEKDNIIWVCHAISGDTDVLNWWSGLFGEDKLFNPEEHFIICASSLGSPYGSTKPHNSEFPIFTVRDQAQVYIHLANELGITKIHTLIGGSFGGYQALEFAYTFSNHIEHLILLATSARESAWGIAIHEAQRLALKADPTFGRSNEGLTGLKAARALAMLTYRTSYQLIKDQTDVGQQVDGFKASSYINYQGDKFSKRFDSLCLYYLTKCIDSHNIGRLRGGEKKALQKINIPTLVIGFNSDMLVPISSQIFLADHLPNASLSQIDSSYGHDGFLMETEKITQIIQGFYLEKSKKEKRVVLKFGGTSLYGKERLDTVVNIIQNEYKKNPIVLLVSARGKTTDMLLDLYHHAKNGEAFSNQFENFVSYLKADLTFYSELPELSELKNILDAIKLLKIESSIARDKVLAFGELISAKTIAHLLEKSGLNTQFIDARDCLYCNTVNGKLEINLPASKTAILKKFQSINTNTIPIFPGFIASNEKNETVTLGRNGSNYSASLIAQFLQASEVQNWTDVDGIYSADPSTVNNVRKIKQMTFMEANELAMFGMNLLHPKSILPLKESNIPLRIMSTKEPHQTGTIINQTGGEKGIKAVSSTKDICLISIEGGQLKQNIGIDARIFSCLSANNINVKMISQASTENGIGFIVDNNNAKQAEKALRKEFERELNLKHITSIKINSEVGIVSIIGRHNYALEKAISTLRKNGVWMHLICNSISGENISLVVDKQFLNKAINLVHDEVYGSIKTINVFAFGKGKVGAEFINQILHTPSTLVKERKINIKIIGVCDSKRFYINPNGLDTDWEHSFEKAKKYESIDFIIKKIKELHLNHLVMVDNTASLKIGEHYEQFINSNFDLVASNKAFNAGDYDQYKSLRKTIRAKGRKFHYEANVGAGLPIIDLLKNLKKSADQVVRLRGVFSGSLSYIFNNFSDSDLPFSHHMESAIKKGFAEPDPRMDLTGLDVARKLVILARELNCTVNLEDVEIENLIPESLRNLNSLDAFYAQIDKLNSHYQFLKETLNKDEVLRYVADLNVVNMQMVIKLTKIEKSDPLANIKNADNFFEIYTTSYKEQPIIIQGKGAGPVVTARGVYSDIIRIS